MLRQPRTGVKQLGRIRQTGKRETVGVGNDQVCCVMSGEGVRLCGLRRAVEKRWHYAGPHTRMPQAGPQTAILVQASLLALAGSPAMMRGAS